MNKGNSLYRDRRHNEFSFVSGSDSPVQLSLFDDEAPRRKAEAAEVAVDDIRRRFGYRAIGRALFLKDREIGLMAPKVDHTIHPVGYLQNATMDSVVGKR